MKMFTDIKWEVGSFSYSIETDLFFATSGIAFSWSFERKQVPGTSALSSLSGKFMFCHKILHLSRCSEVRKLQALNFLHIVSSLCKNMHHYPHHVSLLSMKSVVIQMSYKPFYHVEMDWCYTGIFSNMLSTETKVSVSRCLDSYSSHISLTKEESESVPKYFSSMTMTFNLQPDS